MCVNDLIGARRQSQLIFLDYYATAKLESRGGSQLSFAASPKDAVRPVAALAGGETAEMPGMYGEGRLRPRGLFARRARSAARCCRASTRWRTGDIVIIGLASSGPHSNGYSARAPQGRRTFRASAWDAPSPFENGGTLAEALLAPTRIYAKALKPIFDAKLVKGAAHITGGGLVENTPRALPDHLAPAFDWSAWARPPVFQWLQQTGDVPEEDMRRTFNLGVGMILLASPANANAVIAQLNDAGERAFKIGVLADA